MNVFGFLLYLLPKRLRQGVKIMLFATLGGMLLAVGPALAQEGAAQASGPFAIFGQLQTQLVNLVEWINGLGAIAPLVFILAYVVITVAFLPASIITLGRWLCLWRCQRLYFSVYWRYARGNRSLFDWAIRRT